METIERFYNQIVEELKRIKVPQSFQSPSGSFFVDKIMATNDIVKVFGSLNAILASLDMEQVDAEKYVDKIRDGTTTKEIQVRTLVKLSSVYYKKKGDIINKVREKLEMMRE
jgi:hypothetical protein